MIVNVHQYKYDPHQSLYDLSFPKSQLFHLIHTYHIQEPYPKVVQSKYHSLQLLNHKLLSFQNLQKPYHHAMLQNRIQYFHVV